MDIALSLPVVSYVLGPGASSWSTSLNLLFFYMTWTTLVLSYEPLHIQIVGVLALRLLFFLLPSLLFLALDTLLPSLAVNIKFAGNGNRGTSSALPPRNARLLGKLLLLALANLLLEAVLQASVGFVATTFSTTVAPLFHLRLPAPTPFKTTAPPLPWQIFKQLALLTVVREAAVYYSHRYLLSSPSSPSYLSRSHTTTYAHTRGAPPFSLLLFADHPLSVLFLRLVPLYASALAVRPHLLVFFLFVALVTVEETLAMSGYTVVPGIILRGIARRTAAHYCGGTDSSVNYGAWGLLDWAHGTTEGSGRRGKGDDSIVQDAKDEVQHHQSKREKRKQSRKA